MSRRWNGATGSSAHKSPYRPDADDGLNLVAAHRGVGSPGNQAPAWADRPEGNLSQEPSDSEHELFACCCRSLASSFHETGRPVGWGGRGRSSTLRPGRRLRSAHDRTRPRRPRRRGRRSSRRRPSRSNLSPGRDDARRAMRGRRPSAPARLPPPPAALADGAPPRGATVLRTADSYTVSVAVITRRWGSSTPAGSRPCTKRSTARPRFAHCVRAGDRTRAPGLCSAPPPGSGQWLHDRDVERVGEQRPKHGTELNGRSASPVSQTGFLVRPSFHDDEHAVRSQIRFVGHAARFVAQYLRQGWQLASHGQGCALDEGGNRAITVVNAMNHSHSVGTPIGPALPGPPDGVLFHNGAHGRGLLPDSCRPRRRAGRHP